MVPNKQSLQDIGLGFWCILSLVWRFDWNDCTCVHIPGTLVSYLRREIRKRNQRNHHDWHLLTGGTVLKGALIFVYWHLIYSHFSLDILWFHYTTHWNFSLFHHVTVSCLETTTLNIYSSCSSSNVSVGVVRWHVSTVHHTSALISEVWEEYVFLREDKQSQSASSQGVVVHRARVR